jgi:chemotaxis protein methyltransferase CheR
MLVEVSARDLERLKVIVREETGNQVEEKNHSMLISRIRGRLSKLGIETMDDYWSFFASKEIEEREVLRGLMTTHYTFFFREYVHFEKLREWIHANSERIKQRYSATKEPLRVWSAACSRGQEVYSLACFLELESKDRLGVPYEILGTDIDSESVRYARNGVYPIKEVNTIPSMYLSRFWRRGTGQVKDFAAAHPLVKERATFDVVNLLALGKWKPDARFDVIFCRNVFIYFSEENVRAAARELARRLDPHGLIISGLSEPIRFAGWDLQTVGPSCYSMVNWTAPIEASPVVRDTGSDRSPAESSRSTPHLQVVARAEESKYRVLVVDDSTTIQLLMKKIFSQDPLCKEVVIANNGREANEKLSGGQFDLITLDIHMPEVNGIEFLERYYNAKSHPPVVMVSSVNRSDIELATKSIQLGAFDYVEKPSMNALQKSATEILTKTKMALRSRSAPQAAPTLEFDRQIAQRIVVPDASTCLRIALVDLSRDACQRSLEWIVRGQDKEYRSPALLVINTSKDDKSENQAQILSWSSRSVLPLRTASQFLRPNTVYISHISNARDIISQARADSVSLQLLQNHHDLGEGGVFDRDLYARFTNIQILIDETFVSETPQEKTRLEHRLGRRVSDWCPATSFASISLEFFANLRKAAA